MIQELSHFPSYSMFLYGKIVQLSILDYKKLKIKIIKENSKESYLEDYFPPLTSNTCSNYVN